MSDRPEQQEPPSDGVERSLGEFVGAYLEEDATQSDVDPRQPLSGCTVAALVALVPVVFIVALVLTTVFGIGMAKPEPSRLTQLGYDVQVRPALIDMSAELRGLGFDAPEEREIPLIPSGRAQQLFATTGDTFWVDLDPIPVAASGADDDAVLGIVSRYDTNDDSLTKSTYGSGYIGSISILGDADVWYLRVEFSDQAGRSAHISVSTTQAGP